MSDTANFDTNEKVNFLFKKDMGFSSTKETTPWFQETNVIVNDNFFAKNLLVSEIPINPNFNINISTTDVNLTNSDFATSSSTYGVIEDSTRTVRQYIKLILEPVPNSGNNAYYKLDSNGNNVLSDALQFNTNWDLTSAKPYPYVLTNQSNISVSPNSPDEILQNSTGGNWIFDIKNGIIFFPDYNSNIVNGSNNKPVLTFYKYIGQKGGNFKNNSDNSFNNIDINGVILAKGLNEMSQIKVLYYNPISGEITYDNSGGITQGSNVFFLNVDISENLYVNSDVSFQRNLDVSGILIATRLKVLGDVSFNEKVNIIDSLTVLGDVSFGNKVFLNGKNLEDFLGSSDISYDKNVDISENLYVAGDVSFQRNQDVIGNLTVNGSITSGSVVIGSVNISETDLKIIDSITPGIADASKALVLDNNKDIERIHNLTIDGNFTNGNYIFDTNGDVTGLGSVSCGAITSTGNIETSGTITGGSSITLNSTTITSEEIGVLDSVSPGTAVASKAVVLDSNLDISGLGNISFTNKLLPENNTALLPISYSSCSLITTGLDNDLTGTSTGWNDATGFILSKILQSQHSYVKIEIKANYISSPAANETMSFRVLKSIDGGLNYEETPVFTDLYLGATFGISIKNIYTGLFYDIPNGTDLTYKLQFKREGSNIITPYGMQSGSNYFFIQEIYRPNA